MESPSLSALPLIGPMTVSMYRSFKLLTNNGSPCLVGLGFLMQLQHAPCRSAAYSLQLQSHACLELHKCPPAEGKVQTILLCICNQCLQGLKLLYSST